MRKCTLLKAERGCFYEEENYTAILSGAVAGDGPVKIYAQNYLQAPAE